MTQVTNASNTLFDLKETQVDPHFKLADLELKILLFFFAS